MSEEEGRPSILARLRPVWRHMHERKFVIWTGAYVSGALAFNEGFQFISTLVALPDLLLRTVPVLLMIGLLLAAVLAWFHGERGRQRVTLPEGALLIGITLLAVVLVKRTAVVDVVTGEDGLSTSFLIDPHRVPGTSAEELDLVMDAAAALTSFLGGWDEIRVRSEAQEALVFSLGISESPRSSLEDSFKAARASGAETLVIVAAEIFGDIAELSVALYDVEGRRRRGPPRRNRGSKDDVVGLVLPVAQKILGLARAPPNLILERESISLEATRQSLEGRRSLGQWELEGAERAFRAALEADSMMARAHRDLGMTLYWQVARDTYRSGQLGPEIRRHAVTAVRHVRLLPFRDSLHALAFRALALGEFVEARERYSSLVERDDSDVFAWLMLGATEYKDEGTIATGPMEGRPRGNWNVAQRAFLKAVALEPEITLGYGFLFDMYGSLAGVRTLCPPYRGFRQPGAVDVATAQAAAVGQIVYFCPAHRDSIEWLTSTELNAADRTAIGMRGDDVAALALDQLRRWGDYAPASPRPLEELSDWFLEQRRRVGGPRGEVRADSLAGEALRHATEALALSRDTTPEHFIRLGALTLASGDLERALVLSEEGLRRLQERDSAEWVPPEVALNVYLAAGRVERVRELVDRTFFDTREFQRDPETDRPLAFAAELALHRIRFLGALGLDILVEQEFRGIDERWTVEGYSERERRILRGPRVRLVAPALLRSNRRRAQWVVEGDSTYWAPFFMEGTQRAAALDRALARYREENPDFEAGFVLGTLCEGEGRFRDAVELMRGVRGVPYSVDQASTGWGVRVLAALVEGRALEALGDAGAAEPYRFVVSQWGAGSPLLEPFVAEAREALARLGALERQPQQEGPS